MKIGMFLWALFFGVTTVYAESKSESLRDACVATPGAGVGWMRRVAEQQHRLTSCKPGRTLGSTSIVICYPCELVQLHDGIHQPR